MGWDLDSGNLLAARHLPARALGKAWRVVFHLGLLRPPCYKVLLSSEYALISMVRVSELSRNIVTTEWRMRSSFTLSAPDVSLAE